MDRVFRWVIVALLVLVPAAAAAQEPLTQLTVDRAVQAALTRNAWLRAARAGVDEAAARTTEARSGLFPSVSLTESWQRGDQPVFIFSSLLSARQFAANNFAIDALNHPDASAFFRTSVAFEHVVFDGGRRRSAVTSAGGRHAIAVASTNEAAASLAVATTQTFGRIVSAEAAGRALDAGLAAAREDLARVERRRDAGMATDADVLALAVHVADLQQRAIQAAGDAATARAELNRLMGDPIDTAWRVAEPQSPPLDDFGDFSNVTGLLAEADAARPELARAAAAERIADTARRQARAALAPQIALQGAIDVAGVQFVHRAASWVVGAEARWTFSTGGGERAAMKAAAASTTRARAEADEARAAVHVDVVTATRRLETARARFQVARAAVDQARESQRIVRDRFDAGLAPVNDVLRTSTAVLDAEASRTAAVVDISVSTAIVRRALGRTP